MAEAEFTKTLGAEWISEPARSGRAWSRVSCPDIRESHGWLRAHKRITIVEPPFPFTVGEGASSVERDFKELRDLWRRETWFMSSIKKRTSNAAYLSIIGMGKAVIPSILAELETTPDHWFVALQAITREVLGDESSSMDDLRRLWIEWGHSKGLSRQSWTSKN